MVITYRVDKESEGDKNYIKTRPLSYFVIGIAEYLIISLTFSKVNRMLPFLQMLSLYPYNGLTIKAMMKLSCLINPPKKREFHSSSQEWKLNSPTTFVEKNSGLSLSSTPSPLYLINIF